MGSKRRGVAHDRLVPASSWALYDFANTIFYAVVVTRYLPPHIFALTKSHSAINLANFPAMIAAAFAAPLLGAAMGRRGTSKRAVLMLTVLCVACTGLLAAARSSFALLALFAMAQVFYQLALVPYNNLLPAVACPARMGRVSGLGVGLGYAGVILSLLVVQDLVERYPGASTAYLAAALLFAVFTIPLALCVPEKPPEPQAGPERAGAHELRDLLRDRGRRYFIAGNFCCADALNAIFFYMTVFLQEGLGFEDARITHTLVYINAAAFLAGILWGPLTDAFTSRLVMILSALALGAAVAAAQFLGDAAATVWILAGLGGPGVAGLWVAGRKWVVQLAPAGRTGGLFGVYGMTNKLSLVNSLFFGALADWTGGYACSVAVILVTLAAGVICLSRAALYPGQGSGLR